MNSIAKIKNTDKSKKKCYLKNFYKIEIEERNEVLKVNFFCTFSHEENFFHHEPKFATLSG